MRIFVALSGSVAVLTVGAADMPTPLLGPAPEPIAALLEESATATNAVPDAPVNPYQIIVTRNPFGLKPPDPGPSAEDLAAAQQVVPSELKLTAITTLLGGRRAMFVLQPPSKTNIFSGPIVEGDWDTVITNLQVLAIDEKNGAVKVVYGGKELSLDFARNGLQPMVGPAPPAPGLPGAPGQPVGRPGIVTAGFQPGAPNAAAMIQMAAPPSMMSDTGIRRIPPRISRANSTVGAAETTPGITPAQQIQMFQEAERVAREIGIPMPPSPTMGGNQPQAHQDVQLGQDPSGAIPPPRNPAPPGFDPNE